MPAKKPIPKERHHVRVFVSATHLDNSDRRRIAIEAIQRCRMVARAVEITSTADPGPTTEACLREVADAHVYVGILAWRYGWMPDGQASITELEYRKARELGIPCLVFIISPDVNVNPRHDFDDDGGDKWKKQELLEQFKQRVRDDGQQPGLFLDDTQLALEITQALHEWHARETGPDETAAAPASPATSDGDLDLTLYRRWIEELGRLRLIGFSEKHRLPLRLEELFVDVQVVVDHRAAGMAEFADAKDALERVSGDGRHDRIQLADAFRTARQLGQRPGIVLLGDPGSGKTTQLKRLALWLLREDPSQLGLPAGMLPVFLPLRELVDPTQTLEALLTRQLTSPHWKFAPDFVVRLLARGTLLFLLDGLDEIADSKLRGGASRWIEDAVSAYPTCRFAVTCRYAGYTKTARLDARFLELHLPPLTPVQADQFVRAWFRAVEGVTGGEAPDVEARAKARADRLLTQLQQPDYRSARVAEMTRNPLLLTAVCLVQLDHGNLPKGRAQLYKECVEVLLERWRRAKGEESREKRELPLSVTADQARRVLQPLALWMHGKERRTRASAEEIEKAIEAPLRSIQWPKDAATFLRAIRDESGILLGWSDRTYGFLHLGFQEYLAAREVRTRAFEEPEVLTELAKRFGDSWWNEVILLLLALEDPSVFVPFFKEVVQLPQFAEQSALVDMCLSEAAQVSAEPFMELLRTKGKSAGFRARQRAAARVAMPLMTRGVEAMAEAVLREQGMLASTKGRPTRRLGGLVDVVWIPGGTFRMGSPDGVGDSDEHPQHDVTLSGFWLAATVVTNAQYGRFLAETRAPEPKHWGDRAYNQLNQPVVGVSWHDSTQFCQWLVQDGVSSRLPTEPEWEYACRAGTTTAYCTGDREADLSRVGWHGGNSQHGLHPVAEREPNGFGLFDMHGNVWEWCADWKGPYTKEAQSNPRGPKSGSARVFRGGSWLGGPVWCRSAYRNGSAPNGRGDLLGFRVAWSGAAP